LPNERSSAQRIFGTQRNCLCGCDFPATFCANFFIEHNPAGMRFFDHRRQRKRAYAKKQSGEPRMARSCRYLIAKRDKADSICVSGDHFGGV
jgi:hypothetical protein